MRYLQSFNEKFGIDFGIEEQTREFFKEIQDDPDSNFFIFVLNNKNGKYPFFLKIGKFDGDTKGMYSLDLTDYTSVINLKDRNDYSTLLHEIKHLDYATKRTNFYKDIFHQSKTILSKLRRTDPLKYAYEIFYLLDTNEFESRYHGYYVDFDEFISNNFKKNPSDTITPGDIYDLFEKFLAQTDDKSWTWYVKDDEFRFEDYFSKSQINKLFNQFIYTKDFYKDEYNNILNYIKSLAKKSFKTTFNSYTKEELNDIQRTKKMIESQINRKLPKYRKKFFKLVPLMVDKWCE